MFEFDKIDAITVKDSIFVLTCMLLNRVVT